MERPPVAFPNAEWPSQDRGHSLSSPLAPPSASTPVRSRSVDAVSAVKCTATSLSPDKACHQRSQMVASWQDSGDASKLRSMHEPHVGGVPRSVLSRLLSFPSAGSPNGSPRRKCSAAAAAAAAVAAMVHSPRAFNTGEANRHSAYDSSPDSPRQQCYSPIRSFSAGFGGSSNCSSQCSSPMPLSTHQFGEQPTSEDCGGDSKDDEVVMLRQQVALLVKSLEDEKKRRASEQNLMQTKIIELQGLIRQSLPEQQRDHDMIEVETDLSSSEGPGKKFSLLQLAQVVGSPARENERVENDPVHGDQSAPVNEEERSTKSTFTNCGCKGKTTETSGEAAAKLQLTKLRARMHAVVIDSQREVQTLRAQLEGAKRDSEKRERQLRLESSIHMSQLEQKHTAATTRLAQQAANGTAKVTQLEAEKQELLECVEAQRKRLEHLELALGGKKIVEASRWT